MEITLAKLSLADIDEEYVSWYQNTDGHLDHFTGSARSFDQDTLLKDFELGLKTQQWFYYLIVGADNVRIGNVKVGPIDLRNRTSDLVCLIGNRNYVGRGIASSAIRLANVIAFEQHGIRRLQGGMYASNVPSIRAYTRAGWVIEATLPGFYWVNEKPEDRVCVACLNPAYFPNQN